MRRKRIKYRLREDEIEGKLKVKVANLLRQYCERFQVFDLVFFLHPHTFLYSVNNVHILYSRDLIFTVYIKIHTHITGFLWKIFYIIDVTVSNYFFRY